MCEIDIFCMISSDNGQGTTVLPSQLIKLISVHDIDVVLDLYMEQEDE